tara:strand:- start:4491 stop:4784 length:294 start_codon:yes stop_codon:yes gene_type:complete
MKVENMKNNNNNIVKNQFIITAGNKKYFQSYNRIIVMIEYDIYYSDEVLEDIYIDPDYYDYSKTTTRYRNIFLGVSNDTFKKNLKENKYTFKSLNNE